VIECSLTDSIELWPQIQAIKKTIHMEYEICRRSCGSPYGSSYGSQGTFPTEV